MNAFWEIVSIKKQIYHKYETSLGETSINVSELKSTWAVRIRRVGACQSDVTGFRSFWAGTDRRRSKYKFQWYILAGQTSLLQVVLDLSPLFCDDIILPKLVFLRLKFKFRYKISIKYRSHISKWASENWPSVDTVQGSLIKLSQSTDENHVHDSYVSRNYLDLHLNTLCSDRCSSCEQLSRVMN